jgi:hypothetical protein
MLPLFVNHRTIKMAKKRKGKSADELSTENELMKLKMMAEFGGDFAGSDDIPPDIENQFLKQIINFHKQHDNSKTTTVYKFIGEPEYNHVKDLSDTEVEKELKHLLKLMSKKRIALSALAETPKREIYRFITEELFKHEIEDVKLKGWVSQFIYEDFHPNQEYDVRNAVFYLLQSIFNKESAIFEENFSDDMKDTLGLSIDVEEFIERVNNFKQEWNNLKLEKYDLSAVEIDKDLGTANIECKVTYKTQQKKGNRFKTQTASLEIFLEKSKHSDAWWEVKRVVSDLF